MSTLQPRRALVLFSGGQDSATCLAWALSRYAWVETIGFDYGPSATASSSTAATTRSGRCRSRSAWAWIGRW